MDKVLGEINSHANEEKAKHLMRFFKTGKGQYGEGDLFLGITVPTVRAIAKKYYNEISFADIQKLIENPYHEIRLLALLSMIFIYQKTNKREEIVELYLKNIQYINNWDLVDLSCPKILGPYVCEENKFEIIYKLAASGQLWAERISVVTNWYLIKQGEFSVILTLAEKFLYHKHDLMQKAVGWMLREMGKKDENQLYDFLDKYCKVMPRTMLRYSIEKLPPVLKKHYMAK